MSETDQPCHALQATEVVDHLAQGRLGLTDYVSAMHEHTVATDSTVKDVRSL